MNNQSRNRSAGGSGPGRVFYLAILVVVIGGIVALWLARSGDAGPTEIPVTLAETEADASAGVSAGPEDAALGQESFPDRRCHSRIPAQPAGRSNDVKGRVAQANVR